MGTFRFGKSSVVFRSKIASILALNSWRPFLPTVDGQSAARAASSASQQADGGFHATGHPIAASFETGETWFYDYRTRKMTPGEKLVEPRWHPEDQPAPGPAGKVPRDWEACLH